jgi:phosphoglucosamine mutase
VEKIKNKLGDKGRILLRPSGTEPVIRIMVEAEDAVLVDKTINELSEILKNN